MRIFLFNCNFISRILYLPKQTSIIYLGTRSPGSSSNLPVTDLSEQLFRRSKIPNRDLFGLAIHKVYPTAMSPRQCVSSYLTFSPFPHQGRGGYFLRHWLFPCRSMRPSR